MKTAYYNFIAWNNAMAAGFDDGRSEGRQCAMIRQPEKESGPRDGGQVIDLTAWRAANLDELEDEPDWAVEEEVPAISTPRPRKSHDRAVVAAELVSTLSVVAVAVVLILRVLTF